MSLRRAACAISACALAAAVALGGSAGAQTARPSPAPTAVPTPSGFTARAHANVTVTAQGTAYDGAAQLGVEQREQLTRIDLLSVKSAALPIPPITATVVIDRRANTLTLWSDATKTYRVQPFIPRPAASATPRPGATARPSATPRPSGTPRPARRASSPFEKLDVLDVSLKLTGHTTTAGLPTTGLAFDLQVRNKGDQATSHVTATTQLADGYAIFPVTLDVSVEPGAAPFGAKLAYAVDSFTSGLPPPARFQIPAGYTEAPSLMSVLFPRRGGTSMPVRPPSPRPSPSP
ncbi:MAG TPA: hypothetical protein VFF00_08605 [Candidatus Elarobacter sp.]|nr:hypothetical protein [Candidatus Elarobacter sp.]